MANNIDIEDSRRQNDKFKLGRAVHMLVLEPEKFHEKFYVMMNDVDLRTKVGKEAYADAENSAKGRDIIRANDYREIAKISESVLSHSLWKTFDNRLVEQSIFWDAGLFNTRLRSRPDVYNDKIIIDIKTTDSIKAFSNSIYQYGYHRQAAMQIDGLRNFDEKERTFAFFVVEKKEPYLTACFVLDEASIEQGRREYHDGAVIYSECLQNKEWPGY
jgi:exodeoxyribonuclease VIII